MPPMSVVWLSCLVVVPKNKGRQAVGHQVRISQSLTTTMVITDRWGELPWDLCQYLISPASNTGERCTDFSKNSFALVSDVQVPIHVPDFLFQMNVVVLN